eukprot:403331145
MVFAYHIIDSFRNLLALLYVVSFLKFDIIEIIYDFLALNSLLGVATLIIIHERFSEQGKLCSTKPDNFDSNKTYSSLLIDRGQLLYSLVIIYWGVLGFQCICCCGTWCGEANSLSKFEKEETSLYNPPNHHGINSERSPGSPSSVTELVGGQSLNQNEKKQH